jgi:MscS family membrane protein
MNDIFNRMILDNTIAQYIFVFVLIALAYVLKKYVGRAASKIIFLVMNLMGRKIDEKAFIDLVLYPVQTFLFWLITISAIYSLQFPKLFYFQFLKTNTHRLLNIFSTAALVITFFWVLMRIIDYLAMVMERRANLTADQSDNQLVVFFKDFLKVIVAIAGLLAVLKFALQIDITKILAGLSIVAAALALSARESLENLIASFIIFFDKPFATGDTLKVQNVTGTVEKIGLRSTRIRTTDKTYVSVPNKQMVDTIVDNWSLRTQRKVELRLSLGLSTKSSQLQQFIEGLHQLLNHEKIENKIIFLSDIQQNSYLVYIDYFTAPIAIEDFNKIREEVNMGIILLTEKLGIEFAGMNTDVRVTEVKSER